MHTLNSVHASVHDTSLAPSLWSHQHKTHLPYTADSRPGRQPEFWPELRMRSSSRQNTRDPSRPKKPCPQWQLSRGAPCHANLIRDRYPLLDGRRPVPLDATCSETRRSLRRNLTSSPGNDCEQRWLENCRKMEDFVVIDNSRSLYRILVHGRQASARRLGNPTPHWHTQKRRLADQIST